MESLESRLTLSAVAPVPASPVYVAPPAATLAPIELPPIASLPSGTTQLLPPPAGQLPSGLSPIAGAAEALAVNAAIAFQTAHPAAVQTVTDTVGASSFSVTVTDQDGADYFTYMVSETTKQINVGFLEHDTTTNTVVAAYENPAQKNGELVAAQLSQSNTLISLEVVKEQKGVQKVSNILLRPLSYLRPRLKC